MTIWKKYPLNLIICAIAMLSTATSHARHGGSMISGKVLSTDGTAIDYATVFLKGTALSCSTDDKGLYHLHAPAGEYTVVFSSVGFESHEA